jgi:hypothetical protein
MLRAVSRAAALSPIPSTNVARVRRLIVDPGGPDPLLLLGAGASVMSGVPPARQVAAMAAKWAYCREHGLTERDPRVQRSDWVPWIRALDWFDDRVEPEDQYPAIIEHLLLPREERRRFFLRILSERVEPSRGYRALAELVAKGWIRTMTTTNFDDLLPEVLRTEPGIATFDIIKTPFDAKMISTDPTDPQIVFLHGAVEHYTDQNLEHETEHIEPTVRARLTPLLRDHPLVVVGYRGAERSVMVDLLADHAEGAQLYPHGIFWCVRDSEVDPLGPLVVELAAKVGSNFEIVPISGFDDAMVTWSRDVAQSPRRPPQRDQAPPLLDLRAVPDYDLDDLDWSRAQDTVITYAQRLAIVVPDSPDREWVIARLEDANLLVRDGESVVPTHAGMLLFGTGAPVRVDIEHEGLRETVNGSLLVVLDRCLALLADLNEPFRLKGPTSATVHAHPPAAIKELVVNALVHRDYESDAPIRVIATDATLRIVSPGGLVSELDLARLGDRGVRAYRNPVLANFLYGIGAVDKAGSGLPDVQRWARDNGGRATFSPGRDNTSFIATLHARPERPDPVTRTADPGPGGEVFTANILPVTFARPVVYRAGTDVESVWQIFDAHPDSKIPAFVHHGDELLSFASLTDGTNPLTSHSHGSVSVAAEDFIGDPDEERLLVQLLNRSVHEHARSLGLCVLPWANRLYFDRVDEGDGSRQVTYQARARQATRTVARPWIGKTSGRTLYWEHQSVRFRFRRFQREWALLLVPGWVFTTDGRRHLLRGPRVGPLSTRRSARDFNQNVANHLHFWANVLCGGEDRVELGDGALVLDREFVARHVSGTPPVASDDELVADLDLDDDVSEELGEIAREQTEEEG